VEAILRERGPRHERQRADAGVLVTPEWEPPSVLEGFQVDLAAFGVAIVDTSHPLAVDWVVGKLAGP